MRPEDLPAGLGKAEALFLYMAINRIEALEDWKGRAIPQLLALNDTREERLTRVKISYIMAGGGVAGVLLSAVLKLVFGSPPIGAAIHSKSLHYILEWLLL